LSYLCAVDVEAEPGGAAGGQTEDVEAAARQEAIQLSGLGLKRKFIYFLRIFLGEK
jgi:hypothetical protein